VVRSEPFILGPGDIGFWAMGGNSRQPRVSLPSLVDYESYADPTSPIHGFQGGVLRDALTGETLVMVPLASLSSWMPYSMPASSLEPFVGRDVTLDFVDAAFTRFDGGPPREYVSNVRDQWPWFQVDDVSLPVEFYHSRMDCFARLFVLDVELDKF